MISEKKELDKRKKLCIKLGLKQFYEFGAHSFEKFLIFCGYLAYHFLIFCKRGLSAIQIKNRYHDRRNVLRDLAPLYKSG